MAKSTVLRFPVVEFGETTEMKLTVAAAPADSLFRKMQPSHAREMKELYSGIESAVAAHLDVQRNRVQHKKEQIASASVAAQHMWERSLPAKLNAIEEKQSKALRSVEGYSLATRRVILDSITGGDIGFFMSLMERSGHFSEAQLRELLSYRDISHEDPDTVIAIFNSVRVHDDKFAVEDLSALTGSDRSEATALYQLIETVLSLNFERLIAGYDQAKMHSQRKRLDRIKWTYSHEIRLTESVGEIAIAYPRRISEIATYVLERGWEVTDSEIEHLMLRFENKAPALTEGVL